MSVWIIAVLFISFSNVADADELTIRDHSRAKLLYETHCIACHTEQIHWRTNKRAANWKSLKSEVRHWQDVLNLEWSDDDVERATHYLNALYYHFQATDLRVRSNPNVKTRLNQACTAAELSC